jgi:hypothetical protein
MARGRKHRHFVLGALTLALALAIGSILLATLNRGGRPSLPSRDPTGPGLRLAGRAGLATVGLTARARSLELETIVPDESPVAVTSVRVQVVDPAGRTSAPALRSCQSGCSMASVRLARGTTLVRVEITFEDRTRAATSFAVPWPPGPSRQKFLTRVVTTMTRLRAVTVRERVTSDPRRGFYPGRPERITGRELAELEAWAPAGAQDVRELPRQKGLRVIAYAIPTAQIWYELWIDRDDLIHRERFTGPNHLIERSFSRPVESTRH